MGLAAGSNLLLIDCEPAVVHTIASARAASTRQLYATCWNFFSSWCKSQGLDPVSCDVPKMLSILQQILESGKAASTLKVYAAAISAYHVPINESSLGSYALCSFLNGETQLRPTCKPHFPRCDLPFVLDFLCSPPFEPLQAADLRWMSLKAVFVMALASAKRVSELHALSVSELCMRWLPDDSGVVLRPNPSFLPKVLLPQFINQSISLAAFQSGSQSDQLRHQGRFYKLNIATLHTVSSAVLREQF